MSFPVRAHTIPKISNHSPAFDVDEVKRKYLHLRDVEVKLDDESIDLLIGQDCPVLLRQLEARYGKPDEPYAVRTVLGWTICGPIDGAEDDERSAYFISSASQLSVQDNNFSLRNFWEIEKIPEHKELTFTKKEQQILEHTERTTVKVNDRYQVNLPWRKSNNDQIPDSYDMALRRLESTERRLKKSPILRERYTSAIEEYEKGGYIEKLETKPEDAGWYLPHHPVISEEKNTKCRVVFDSAAKAHGTSLNDLLEKGPCLLNDLTGILLRFRRFKIGIAGDISKMFLRILLNPKDCRFHRFLWRTEEGREPVIYQFNCLIFGDASSPFLASYVIKRVIKEHGSEKPEAANALDRDLYMDDLIRSCKTTGEAKATVEDVCEILDQGGMKMRNWISNQPCVLQGVPDRVKNGPLQLDRHEQKVLGMSWDHLSTKSSSDQKGKFSFGLNGVCCVDYQEFSIQWDC
jgi:hypothetical protein